MFKSIEDSDEVPIDPQVTVLVGQNESGKTAFLQALHRARPVEPDVKYDVIDDYPRRHLTTYERVHQQKPATATSLTYKLQPDEIADINKKYGFPLLDQLSFTLNHTYANTRTVELTVPEQPFIEHLLDTAKLSGDVVKEAVKATTVRELLATLRELDLNGEETAFLEDSQKRFGETHTTWNNMLADELWVNDLRPHIPQFLYFDDYYLLPGKVNLPSLQQRISSNALQDEDRTVLSLLRLADVNLAAVTASAGYEQARAKLEGISNTITDRIFEYWTQSQELEVEIDISTDPTDQPPYNTGNNLYIRIRNRRHRVTVPFSQRSRGFIWFFSFLVWFDGIKDELGTEHDLVLLLDEPGLNLHALGQADLLRYIDVLAENHQLMYTTHSPFMVQSERLHQVRTVEARAREGTKITANVSGSDPKTLFPLQAALGGSTPRNRGCGAGLNERRVVRHPC